MKLRDDLVVGRESPRLLLREDELSVVADLERSAPGLDQLDLDPRERRFQCSLQTEGLGCVVSGYAVLDGHAHGRPSGSGAHRPNDAPTLSDPDVPVNRNRRRCTRTGFVLYSVIAMNPPNRCTPWAAA